MIYVLIAGCYTPIGLLVLQAVAGRPAPLGGVGGRRAGHHAEAGACPTASPCSTGVLYMALGWLGLVALPQFVRGLQPGELSCWSREDSSTRGGPSSSRAGAPTRGPATFGYHEIWHALMVAAAVCHYAMIAMVLRMGP